MSALRHGPPLAMNGYMDKEGRKFRARKTRYFKLKDSALFNHRRKDSLPTWGVSLIDSRVAVGHKSEVIVQLFDGKKISLFPHSRTDCDRWVDHLQRASRRKIGNFYGVTGLVGMGSFAEVRVGYDKSTGQQVAIKVMKKNKRDTELMRSVECEMNFISKNIDHDNIVATYDVFDTRDNLFIVMEYMPGGMLYDILANEGYFSEKNAAAVMRDLLESVKCLHDNDIVHRDIKPENVLALNKTWPLQVKLADFGLADFVLENSFGEKSTCGMYGTPFFVAPEVIRAETYTPAVDIWSLGVLAYNMLSGKLPFDGSNIKEVLRRVRAGRYTFPDAEWGDISTDAKDFIRGLLEVDAKKRLTAREALQHPWLTSTNISERAINNDRSALGYEQRKLRMSSMAIDDVAGLLRLDEEEEVAGGAPVEHGIRALSRLFPGKSAKSARSSGSTRSRPPVSGGGAANGAASPPPVHGDVETRVIRGVDMGPQEFDNSAAVSNAAPLRMAGEEEATMSEVSAGSHQYNAPADMPGWDDALETRRAAVGGDIHHMNGADGISYDGFAPYHAHPHQQVQHHQQGYQAHVHTQGQAHGRLGDDPYMGGLEYNDKFGASGEGFALPAILSVKEIMRRRQEALAAAGGAPGADDAEARRRQRRVGGGAGGGGGGDETSDSEDGL